MVAVASAAFLWVNPAGTWVIPVVLASFGAAVTLAQWDIQHENAAKLAKIADEIERNSMLYERRLDAYAEVTRAVAELTEHADGLFRAVANTSAMPNELPTVWFSEQSKDAVARLWKHGSVLRLLADDPTSLHLDEIGAILNGLDLEGVVAEDRGDIESKIENPRRLESASIQFRRIHQALIVQARLEFRRVSTW